MKAEMIKLKISSVLTRAMCKRQLSIKEVATLSGVAQHRVSSLLNPADTNVDLTVLCKVCDSLQIRVTMRSRPQTSSRDSVTTNKERIPSWTESLKYFTRPSLIM